MATFSPSPALDAISVVIPVHNGASDIVRALVTVSASLRDQDEIVVVNDHSTDDTEAVVSGSGVPVRLLNSIDRGIVAALNFGIEAAHGNLIARCDADDEWLPRDLDQEIGLLRGSRATALFGAAERVASNGEVHVDAPPSDSATLRRVMLRSNVLVHGAVLFDRDEIRRLGGYREYPAAEDYELWLRILRNGNIATSSSAVYRYFESSRDSHADKRRRQAKSTIRILVEHASATGELSPTGVIRNFLSSKYGGPRRKR